MLRTGLRRLRPIPAVSWTAALAAPLLAGCFQYSDVLTLQSDGSGTFAVDVAIDRAALQSTAGQAGATGSSSDGGNNQAADPLDLPTRTELETALGKGAPGVKLVDYRETSTPQRRGFHAEATFATLADLTQMHKVLAQQETAAGDAEVRFAYQRDATGGWSFRRAMGSAQSAQAMAMLPMLLGESRAAGDSSSSAGATDAGPADVARLQQVVSQLMPGVDKIHLRFEARLPGSVGQSNASHVDGKVALWDFDFAHLLAAASNGTLEMSASGKP